MVYPRTNKQNQKKKRKVEPPTPQVGDGFARWKSTWEVRGLRDPAENWGGGRSQVRAKAAISPACLPPSF